MMELIGSNDVSAVSQIPSDSDLDLGSGWSKYLLEDAAGAPIWLHMNGHGRILLEGPRRIFYGKLEQSHGLFGSHVELVQAGTDLVDIRIGVDMVGIFVTEETGARILSVVLDHIAAIERNAQAERERAEADRQAERERTERIYATPGLKWHEILLAAALALGFGTTIGVATGAAYALVPRFL